LLLCRLPLRRRRNYHQSLLLQTFGHTRCTQQKQQQQQQQQQQPQQQQPQPQQQQQPSQ